MRLNEEINVPEVRLIDEEGEMIGVVSIEDAMNRAREAELDLAEISPTATPPVCRIMDYGKYKYKQQKKIHDQKKKTHGNEMKQLRIKTFRIDPHDLGIKMKKARQFLEGGSRLVITLMFRARELSHMDLGQKLLVEQVAAPLEDIAKIDSPPRKEGRRMTMILSPLPNLDRILAKRKSEAEKAARDEAKREEIEKKLAEQDAAEAAARAAEEAGEANEAPAEEASEEQAE